MAEKSWFFNAELVEGQYDREYLAEDFAKYFSMFISNGVFMNTSDALQVVADSTPNMTVKLKPGCAFINGYAYENDTDYVFDIDTADGSLNRIDSIFVRFVLSERTIKAYKAVGNSSSVPAAPSLIRTADYWDLCVAKISVNAGVTSITQSAITDTRLDTDLCGIVHSVIDKIDTKTLYNQIQADLEEFKSDSQAGFNAWFEEINSRLDDGSATVLQKQIDTTNETAMFKKDYDPNGSGMIPIDHGGTGASTAAQAKENLGLDQVNNTADSTKSVKSAQIASKMGYGEVYNQAEIRGYTGTPTPQDGGMFFQADYTNGCVNVGINNKGAIGVNQARVAGRTTELAVKQVNNVSGLFSGNYIVLYPEGFNSDNSIVAGIKYKSYSTGNAWVSCQLIMAGTVLNISYESSGIKLGLVDVNTGYAAEVGSAPGIAQEAVSARILFKKII